MSEWWRQLPGEDRMLYAFWTPLGLGAGVFGVWAWGRILGWW